MSIPKSFMFDQKLKCMFIPNFSRKVLTFIFEKLHDIRYSCFNRDIRLAKISTADKAFSLLPEVKFQAHFQDKSNGRNLVSLYVVRSWHSSNLGKTAFCWAERNFHFKGKTPYNTRDSFEASLRHQVM